MNMGMEWNYQKNLGEGQVFDVTRPISESLSTRPRRFKDIPELQPFAFYAEEVLNLPVNRHKLAFTAGIRLQSLLGLDTKYKMQGKIYPDLRHGLAMEFTGIKRMGCFLFGRFGLDQPYADHRTAISGF